MEILIKNLNDLNEFAKSISRVKLGGKFIQLRGDLGAGKTKLVSLVLKWLKCKDIVTSPTFTILKEYKTLKYQIFHYDLYRTTGEDDLIEIGFYDKIFNLDSREICFIEWPEKSNKLNLYENFIEIIVNDKGRLIKTDLI